MIFFYGLEKKVNNLLIIKKLNLSELLYNYNKNIKL